LIQFAFADSVRWLPIQEAEADSEQGEEVESAKKVAADAELVFEE